eukprot:1155038-Pelagomonas_calceolata.AAC.2
MQPTAGTSCGAQAATCASIGIDQTLPSKRAPAPGLGCRHMNGMKHKPTSRYALPAPAVCKTYQTSSITRRTPNCT